MNRFEKLLVVSLMVALPLVFVSAILADDAKSVGTVSIESKAVAIGVGWSWGDGTLTFEGKDYPFKIKGLSVIDVGISSISAQGDVYSLTKVEDFEGTFSAAEAGIAIGGGVGAQTMKNQNGVLIRLTSKKAGVQLKLAPEGLKVEMK